MSLSLYRKYRPQTFAQVVGQDHVKTALGYQIMHQKLTHAYLFCGPRAVGKTSTARLLAKAVNCLVRKDSEMEPCNTCESCVEITAGKCMDVIEIDAASHTGVDHVREEIINNARIAPSKRKYKVFIIDEVHMLSTAAFNALLKMMEEPPSHILFILATTELHKVPLTIVSRCQRFDFHRVKFDAVYQQLEEISKKEGYTVEPLVLKQIAWRSDGCLRDALSLLGQMLSYADDNKQVTVQHASLIMPHSSLESLYAFLFSLIERNGTQALAQIRVFQNEGVSLSDFFDQLMEHLRFFLLYKVTGQAQEVHALLSEEIQKKVQSLDIPTAELIALIDLCLKRKREMKGGLDAALALELCACEMTVPVRTQQIAYPTIKAPEPKKPEVKVEVPVSVAAQAVPAATVSPVAPAPVAPMPTGPLTLEVVKARWNDIVTESQRQYPSLTFILKVCEPTMVDAESIVLDFAYPFHQEKAVQTSTYHKLTELFVNMLGVHRKLDCRVKKADPASAVNADSLAQMFAGKVVEQPST